MNHGIIAHCFAIIKFNEPFLRAKQRSDLKFVLLILGVSMMIFSKSNYFPLAMLFAVITGFGTMSQSTICNTIIQVNSDKKMRGRVISLLIMVIGLQPVGSLLIGIISQRFGAPNAMFYQGIAALIIAAAFAKFLSKGRLIKKGDAQLQKA